MKASLAELMTRTGVRFGTSGVRGLVTQLSDFIAYAYTRGFLQYVRDLGESEAGGEVAVAGDLRPSTGRIMEAVIRAVEDFGSRPVNCGRIPAPAVALYGLVHRVPAIMVTGSHIPVDRNGIKFNKCTGEVLKADETGISRQVVDLDDGLFDRAGTFARTAAAQHRVRREAEELYVARYLDCFPRDALAGLRLGLYEHSAVGRDLLARVLRGLGANVTPLGRAESFVPVDTEAIRPEDVELARAWALKHRFDAIVSTDGDSDRPLMSDEHGRWLRGDIAGILCARYLGADSVSTPVSSNTALERCGWFREVRRTPIGSPYVIAAMLDATISGFQRVVGYEANGGFLTNSTISHDGGALRALPTRDALILILGVLRLARRGNQSVGALVASLPARFTASGLLKECPPESSRAVLAHFSAGDESQDRAAFDAAFGAELGRVKAINRTDGIRVTFETEEIIHLRPSGNAPEFRCYTEAASPARAEELNARCLEVIRRIARNGA